MMKKPIIYMSLGILLIIIICGGIVLFHNRSARESCTFDAAYLYYDCGFTPGSACPSEPERIEGTQAYIQRCIESTTWF